MVLQYNSRHRRTVDYLSEFWRRIQGSIIQHDKWSAITVKEIDFDDPAIGT